MAARAGARNALAWTLALTMTLWAVLGVPAVWTAVVSFGLAWWLSAHALRRIPAWPAAAVVAVLGAGLLARAGAPWWTELLEDVGLSGSAQPLKDRARLQRLPAIAPAVVFDDHPQVFFVNAPGAQTVTLQLGAQLAPLPAQDWGEGLFRLVYDPRLAGRGFTQSGPLEVTLRVDKREHSRQLMAYAAMPHPRWLRSSVSGGVACAVSEETDELLVVRRGGSLQRVAVADGPTDCAIIESGIESGVGNATGTGRGTRTIVVAHRYASELWAFVDRGEREGLDESKRVQIGPGAVRLAVSPSGERVAVALDGETAEVVWVDVKPVVKPDVNPDANPELNSDVNLTVQRQSLPSAPDWITFNGDDDRLAVASRRARTLYQLSRVDGVTASMSLSRPVVCMERSADGSRLFAAVTAFQPDGAMQPGNHFVQDQILVIDTDAWSVVARPLTARRADHVARGDDTLAYLRGTSPMALDVRDDGALLIAFAGSDEVWRWGPDFAQPPTMLVFGAADVRAPHGVADLGEDVWVVSSAVSGTITWYEGDELRAQKHLAPVDDELSALESARREGEHAFYETTRTGRSCQSCHLHADQDYARHDIGEAGLQPMTLSVRGIAATAPYLRGGDYPDIASLHVVPDEVLGGYMRPVPDRPQALQTYVESLPMPVNPRPPPPSVRAGVKAFVDAKCTVCHSFPAFTNLASHPARWVFDTFPDPTRVLDTPSLRGLWHSAPYLLDGRAEDLRAAWEDAPRHGNVGTLDDEQLRALVELLEIL